MVHSNPPLLNGVLSPSALSPSPIALLLSLNGALPPSALSPSPIALLLSLNDALQPSLT